MICGNANPDAFDDVGLSLQELIFGGPGKDRIFGAGGPDQIISGLGDDTIDGGDGIDELIGTTLAGSRLDRPDGGFDRMSGGAGNDELLGWDGRVHLTGGPGNDVQVGGNRNDRLSGGSGRDRLAGGEGNDTIVGGRGNDILDYHANHGFLSEASHRAGVRVNLSTRTATGARWGRDRLGGDLEKVWTGDGRDTVIGNARANVIYTGFGTRNRVDGRGGRDLLTLDSEAIAGSCCSAARVDLAAGTGRHDSPYGGATRLRIRDIEDVVGSGEEDVLLAGRNRLFGRDGEDTLCGRGGNDRLFGGDNADRLTGGPGRNTNNGGPGRDRCRQPSTGPGCE